MGAAQGGVFLVEIEECVAQTETVARDFIGVGGTDALACGADFLTALGFLVGGVEQTVGGGYEMYFLGDAED